MLHKTFRPEAFAAVATTATEIAKLSLADLNRQISATMIRAQTATTPGRRKLAMAHLTWLEAECERLHGIAAPNRRHRV